MTFSSLPRSIVFFLHVCIYVRAYVCIFLFLCCYRFKVRVEVTPGTHASEDAVNKQLNDKERVAAALENAHLLGVVNKCLTNVDGSAGVV